MRLFIGIELPEEVRHAASQATEHLRSQISSVAPGAMIRWIAPESLHVTIWFVGEVSDASSARLSEALSPPFSVSSFTLCVGGAGAFPKSGEPRAVWLGLVDGRDSLVAIYGAVAARLGPLGFAPEARPYSPHLTIGRVKNIHRRDAAGLRGALASIPGEIGRCTIRHVTLFRSRTSPGGSQ